MRTVAVLAESIKSWGARLRDARPKAQGPSWSGLSRTHRRLASAEALVEKASTRNNKKKRQKQSIHTCCVKNGAWHYNFLGGASFQRRGGSRAFWPGSGCPPGGLVGHDHDRTVPEPLQLGIVPLEISPGRIAGRDLQNGPRLPVQIEANDLDQVLYLLQNGASTAHVDAAISPRSRHWPRWPSSA